MQKMLMILICMFIGSAHATEMCAKNDTVVIPLDATVGAPGVGYNATEWIWWMPFPYGTIYGLATCLSLQEVQEIQNNPNLTSAAGFLDTDSDALVGRSGKDAAGNTRSNCYVKINHPMSSIWMKGSSGSGGCNARNCMWETGYSLYMHEVTRIPLFNAIGASMAE